MNSEDHSEKMPSLVEYTSTLDGNPRQTTSLRTLSRALRPYWARYEQADSKRDRAAYRFLAVSAAPWTVTAFARGPGQLLTVGDAAKARAGP